MTEQVKELRDQIAHHETMAAHHTHLATSLRIQYETITGGSVVDWGNSAFKNRPTKSHKRWVAWLKTNGPATRKMIADDEGLLTGEVPPYADTLGLSVSEMVTAAYPDDMMLRLSVDNPRGHGRPVDVYFLWGQRFDVRPIYGVGPELPDPDALLGVIQPVDVERPDPTIVVQEWEEPTWDDVSEQEEASEPLTRRTWYESHDDIFSLVRAGVKPTPENYQILRDDCPEGANVLEAVALTFSGKIEEWLDEPSPVPIIPEEPIVLPDAPISAAQRRMVEDDWGD